MKKLLWVSLCIILTGCGLSMSQTMPANRLHSPEALGGFTATEVGLASVGADDAIFSPDLFASPPNMTNPSLERSEDARFGGHIGLTKWLDLGIEIPGDFLLKAQLLGPHKMIAERGFSLALEGEISGDVETHSGDSCALLFCYGEPVQHGKYTIRNSHELGGLIFGYRFSKQILIYSGYALAKYSFDGDYDIGNGVVRTFSGRAAQQIAQLGLDWTFDKMKLMVEGSRSLVKIGSSAKNRGYIGANLAVRFDPFIK
jgi:hypothetical protein